MNFFAPKDTRIRYFPNCCSVEKDMGLVCTHHMEVPGSFLPLHIGAGGDYIYGFWRDDGNNLMKHGSIHIDDRDTYYKILEIIGYALDPPTEEEITTTIVHLSDIINRIESGMKPRP